MIYDVGLQFLRRKPKIILEISDHVSSWWCIVIQIAQSSHFKLVFTSWDILRSCLPAVPGDRLGLFRVQLVEAWGLFHTWSWDLQVGSPGAGFTVSPSDGVIFWEISGVFHWDDYDFMFELGLHWDLPWLIQLDKLICWPWQSSILSGNLSSNPSLSKSLLIDWRGMSRGG